MKKLLLLPVFTLLILVWACEKPEENQDAKFRMNKIIFKNLEINDSVILQYSYPDDYTKTLIFTNSDNDRNIYKIVLDDQKRLKTMEVSYNGENEVLRTFIYNDNKVYVTDSYYSESDSESDTTMIYYLNSNGYPDSIDILYYKYTAVIHMQFTWQNNNLVKAENEYKTMNYSYDTSQNIQSITKLPFAFTDDFEDDVNPLFNENMLIYSSEDGITAYSSSEIQYNLNNLMSEQKLYNGYTNEHYLITYTYEKY